MRPKTNTFSPAACPRPSNLIFPQKLRKLRGFLLNEYEFYRSQRRDIQQERSGFASKNSAIFAEFQFCGIFNQAGLDAVEG